MCDRLHPELYHCKRAHQEQVAALNACSPAAAASHRRLAALHAAKACLLMDDGGTGPSAAPRERATLHLLFKTTAQSEAPLRLVRP